MKYKYYIPAVVTFLLTLVFTKVSYAQEGEQKVIQHILHKDSFVLAVLQSLRYERV